MQLKIFVLTLKMRLPLMETSKGCSIGSTLACGLRDPSSNPTGKNQYKQIVLSVSSMVAHVVYYE